MPNAPPKNEKMCTHGYEVIARQAIPAMTEVLVQFLQHPTTVE